MNAPKDLNPEKKRHHGNLHRYYYSTLKFLKISVRDRAAYFWVLGYPLLFIMIWLLMFNTGDQRSQYDIIIINNDPYTLSGDPLAYEGVGNVSATIVDLFDPDTGSENLTLSFKMHRLNAEGIPYNLTAALDLLSSGNIDAVIVIPRNFTEIIIGDTTWYANLAYLTPDMKANITSNTGMDLDYLESLSLPSGLHASLEIHNVPDTIGQTVIQSVFNGLTNDIIMNYNGLQPIEIENYTVDRINFTMFDIFSPGFVIIGSLVAIMMVGSKFGQERELGLMQRLDTTPVPRTIHLLAGGSAQLIYSAIQIAIVLGVLSLTGIRTSPNSSWGLAYLNAMTVAFSCIGLGLIVAALSKTADDAGGIAWLFIIPLQFLSGGFFPIGNNGISEYIPTTYGIRAMRDILTLGASFMDVWDEMAINIGFGIVAFIIGAIIFTKKSKL